MFLGLDHKNQAYFARLNSNGLPVAVTFSSRGNAEFVMSTRVGNLPREQFVFHEVECDEWATIIELIRAGIDPSALGDMLLNMPPVGKC